MTPSGFGHGSYVDSWLLKVDYDGNIQWTKRYNNGRYDEVNCVVQTSDGGYALGREVVYTCGKYGNNS